MIGFISKINFAVNKSAPQIHFIFGVIGTLATVGVTFYEAIKVYKTYSKTKEVIEDVKEENLDQEEECKQIKEIKKEATIKIISDVAPIIGLAAFTLIFFTSSHNTLVKRNVALASAYTLLESSFNEYKKRVIEKYGEKVDDELTLGAKEKEITVTEVDEQTGKVKKKKIKALVKGDPNFNGYLLNFYDSSEFKLNEHTYNLTFIKYQECYLNNRLKANGYLYLNEVLEALGFKATKAGQIVGWLFKNGNEYVDLRVQEIYDEDDPSLPPRIILNPNVQGNILNDVKYE